MIYRLTLSTTVLLLVTVIPSMAFTSASAATSTSYGSSAVGTNYVTSVQRQYLYNGTGHVNAPGPQYQCSYKALSFTVSNAQEITGSLSSDISINFYVVDDNFYRTWAGGACAVSGIIHVLYSANEVSSLSIDVKINNPGKYDFLLINFDRVKVANVNFNAGVIT